MADEARKKRQKAATSLEPVRRAGKPRNPIALAARQRVAGPHRKGASGQRQLQQRLLRKLGVSGDE